MTDLDFEKLNVLMGRIGMILEKYEVSQEDQNVVFEFIDYAVKTMERNK